MKENRFYLASSGVILALISIPMWTVAERTIGHGAPPAVGLPLVIISAIMTTAGILLLFDSVLPRRREDRD